MSKNIFCETFTTCQAQIGPKIKNAENLLKFGTYDISKMPISIFISKIIFNNYLPPARPKLVPKLSDTSDISDYSISKIILSNI